MMMTASDIAQTKKDPVKLQYFIASLIVSFIYFILFTGFKLAPGETALTKPVRELADVTMLPIEPNAPFRWQRNLIATLELLDPTIMSLPNTSYGFSRIRNLEFERPLEPLPSYEFDIQLQDQAPAGEIYFIEPVGDVLESFNHERLTKLDSKLQVSSKPSPIAPDVYWTDQNGAVQTDLAHMSLADIVSDETAFTTTGPTVVSLSSRNELVRVRLIKSCGNPILDQRAVDHLHRTFAVRYAKTASSDTNGMLGDDRTLILSAHWRFAEGIDDDDHIGEENDEYRENWF